MLFKISTSEHLTVGLRLMDENYNGRYSACQVSGDFPSATTDTQSVRSMSGPLGSGDKHASLSYVDPRQPGTGLLEYIL